MLIDWFTVGAQVVNFLILVWLMKRFLYKPILLAIDTREARIAAELADADAKKAEAQKDRDEFQHKNEEFDGERTALISKATVEASAERNRLIGEANKAADAVGAKRQESLNDAAATLHQAIGRRAQEEVFAIARKTLADLATVSLEERIGEVFIRRLREMDGDAKVQLGKALKTASDPAIVRCTFDLPPEQHAAIQNALNETFSANIPLQFETSPELVSGIELTANGQKVAWSISDYLASLEKGIDELLSRQAAAEVQVPLKRERMTTSVESLQSVLDRTFTELSDLRTSFQPRLMSSEVGRITNVSTGIAKVSGLPGVGYEELIQFPGSLLGIAFNLDDDEVGVVLLGDYSHLQAGDEVTRTGRIMDVAVGDGLLGRVIDPMGRPLDGNGPVSSSVRLPIERPAAPIMDRAPVTVPLQTGLKVVDALIPIGQGQRELILGDRQTGKTAIAVDTILNQQGKNVVCVYCAIGQSASAVAKVVDLFREHGAIEYTVVVVVEGKTTCPVSPTSLRMPQRASQSILWSRAAMF